MFYIKGPFTLQQRTTSIEQEDVCHTCINLGGIDVEKRGECERGVRSYNNRLDSHSCSVRSLKKRVSENADSVTSVQRTHF